MACHEITHLKARQFRSSSEEIAKQWIKNMFCDVLSVADHVPVQGMVCDFRQHEDIRVANVWVYHLNFFHEEVDEVPCPHCRVIDQLVVPRPYEDFSSVVVSPMTSHANICTK